MAEGLGGMSGETDRNGSGTRQSTLCGSGLNPRLSASVDAELVAVAQEAVARRARGRAVVVRGKPEARRPATARRGRGVA